MKTDLIYDYFEKKYGLGYVGLIKTIAFASMYIKNIDVKPLSLLCIAPSGHFKSRTTIEIHDIFGNNSLVDLGSDFTIHSLIDKFQGGKSANNKTLSINDLTLLFSSKAPRTKDRLVNALAEVLSEGVYYYGERNNPNLRFKANVNIIANITLNSFNQNKKNFLENTFIERLVPFYYRLGDEKQLAFAKSSRVRKEMCFESKIKLKKTFIENFDEFNEEIINLSQLYRAQTLSPSLTRCLDKVKAIVAGIVILNQRDTILPADLALFSNFLPYFSQLDSKDAEVVNLYLKGLSMSEITDEMGYRSTQAYKIIEKYKKMGVLS